MKKTNKKSKALKNDGNCFFKAFFSGTTVSAICLVLLCLAVSAFMSPKDDSTSNIQIVSMVITAMSLVCGGFVCGKTGKGAGIMTAFLCGCACLGLCYALSTVFDLGGNMDGVYKTISIVLMLVSPVAGAKLSTSNGGNKTRHNKGKM